MDIALNEQINNTDVFLLLKRGEIEKLKEVLVKSKKVDERDKKGNTLLHVAAKRNNIRAIEFLVCEGASMDVENNKGYTPEDVAVIYKNKEAKEILKSAKEAVVNKIIAVAVLWPVLLPIALANITFTVLEKTWDKSVKYIQKIKN